MKVLFCVSDPMASNVRTTPRPMSSAAELVSSSPRPFVNCWLRALGGGKRPADYTWREMQREEGEVYICVRVCKRERERGYV